MTSKCKTCGADIFWALTENGKPMPIDAVSTDNGNLECVWDHNGRVLAHVIAPLFLQMQTEAPRYTSHFATCPDADEHRRK